MNREQADTGRAILLIDEFLPAPDNDGGSLRMVHLLQVLHDLCGDVTFAPHLPSPVGATEETVRRLGVEVVPDGMPVQEHLLRMGGRYDAVIISRPWVAVTYLGPIRRCAPQALLIYDTLDLHFVREYRQARLTSSVPHIQRVLKLKKQELDLVRAADRTLVVTAVEKAILESECPGSDIHVVSNIHAHPGALQRYESRRDILFVGNFKHEPNVDAARVMIAEIWPLIRSELDDARLFLVGGKAPPDLRDSSDERVVFTGRVADLTRAYEDCRLSLAPLRFGAGVKGKVLESMGHGLPVVGTSLAFEGIPVVTERDALIADSPEEVARAAVRLYRDQPLWSRLSDNGPRVVAKHFSFEAARSALRKALKPASAPTSTISHTHA
jgi:O-antigen biosynthesis protein